MAQPYTASVIPLMAEIRVGWQVTITDHVQPTESRDDVTVTDIVEGDLILTPKRPWSHRGHSFPIMAFTGTGDLEVDGRTVHLLRTSSRADESRHHVKTFTFSPPPSH